MNRAEIHPPRYQKEDEWDILSNIVDMGKGPREIFFRTSPSFGPGGAECFLAVILFSAMRASKDIEFASPISQRLLNSVPAIQDIFHSWYPEFQKISVNACTRQVNGKRQQKGVGIFFSGGVDSFYTLLKHKDEITHLILVCGFDIKREDEKLWDQVLNMARTVARETGKSLIQVETNLREFSDAYGWWAHHYFGAGLASVALRLSNVLKKIYIASAESYKNLQPSGSHPMLDPLWSTEDCEIVHDACEASRVDKVEMLSHSDLAMRFLRVCWENQEGAYNCGACEKCLRTMVNLAINGVLGRCQTFKNTLDLNRVRKVKIPNRLVKVLWDENLEAARKAGAAPELIRALEKAVDRYETEVVFDLLVDRATRAVRPFVRAIKSVLLGDRKPVTRSGRLSNGNS
ncbi:MAG: hypothetical protein HY351_04725 [Candidatus Omnitrophica bacterium]|nr:hypothetical protein [Candidatus Omnitrophota bacterium]